MWFVHHSTYCSTSSVCHAGRNSLVHVVAVSSYSSSFAQRATKMYRGVQYDEPISCYAPVVKVSSSFLGFLPQ